jgi:hypothetical protein
MREKVTIISAIVNYHDLDVLVLATKKDKIVAHKR